MSRAAVQNHPHATPRRPFARALENRVRRFVERHGALPPGENVLLAVSGGADSTAMTLILSRIAVEFGWKLAIAHFDHRLRGREDSAADLEFVSELAGSLGVVFVHGAGDVVRRARSRGESVEQAARTLRYRFLARQAKAFGATVVATGHTLDDQAETVLLHLVRGSGLDGLVGIRPRSAWPVGAGPLVARPLLAIRREETARYCHEIGVQPREDATNELLLATRNRVRHEVLPVLRAINRRVDEALVRLADAVYEDAVALDEQATEALRASSRSGKGRVSLELEKLNSLRPAIRSRVLRLALSGVLASGAGIEAVHIEALAKLAASRPGRLDLGRGAMAVRDSRSLVLQRGIPAPARPIPETRLAVPGVTEVGGWRFEVDYAPRGKKGKSAFDVLLDATAVGNGLRVRSRRPGDRLRPAGLGGSRKLQDILVDAKVPRDERDGVPLLLADWGIAWVVGLCFDEQARPGAETEHLIGLRARPMRSTRRQEP